MTQDNLKKMTKLARILAAKKYYLSWKKVSNNQVETVNVHIRQYDTSNKTSKVVLECSFPCDNFDKSMESLENTIRLSLLKGDAQETAKEECTCSGHDLLWYGHKCSKYTKTLF